MRAAVYARVSTPRQALAQTIEGAVGPVARGGGRARLAGGRAARGPRRRLQRRQPPAGRVWTGYGTTRPWPTLTWCWSPSPTGWPGTTSTRCCCCRSWPDAAAGSSSPDRPMSADPHDQLLLGDPRRGRRVRAHPDHRANAPRAAGPAARGHPAAVDPAAVRLPFGSRLDPERPRQPAGVRLEPAEAALVAELFAWYLEPQATLYQLAKRLTDLGIPTPTGKPRSQRGQCPRHPAQPRLHRPGADQPHPGRARTHAQVGHAAGRPRRQPRTQAQRGLDRGAGPSRHRRSSPRRPSRRCRPSWTPTSSSPRATTPATSICCGRWSAAAPAGCRARDARAPRATATTCAAGAPTRCDECRASAAAPATPQPASSTSWSGTTCARC